MSAGVNAIFFMQLKHILLMCFKHCDRLHR